MALIKRPEAGSYEPVIIEDYVKTAVTLAGDGVPKGAAA